MLFDFKVTSVFDKNYDAYKSGKYRYLINSGGSRSSKSYSIMQILVIELLTRKDIKISCYRNLRIDCISTLLEDFKTIINSIDGLASQFVYRKKEATFTCKRTGSIIYFQGTELIHKVLGVKNNIVFFNEISEFNQDVFNQIDQRTMETIFIDYNPSNEFFIDRYKNNPLAKFFHSTYHDNIQNLTKGIINKLRSYDPYEFGSTYVGLDENGNPALFYNGKPVSPENEPPPNKLNIDNGTADRYMSDVYQWGIKAEKPNRIYRNWGIIQSEDYDKLPFDEFYGLDFGISSPTAIVGVKYDGDRTFYVKEILYKPSSEMGMQIYSYLEEKVPRISKNAIIVADSAKAKMINDLASGGYTVIPAIKGSGSVESGLSTVQGFTIFYTNDSYNLDFEYNNYSYEVDRYGVTTDKVIKKDDHLLDALRYIISYLVVYLDIKI